MDILLSVTLFTAFGAAFVLINLVMNAMEALETVILARLDVPDPYAAPGAEARSER